MRIRVRINLHNKFSLFIILDKSIKKEIRCVDDRWLDLLEFKFKLWDHNFGRKKGSLYVDSFVIFF